MSYSALELPFLGTAQWGQTVSEFEANKILDIFYEIGGRKVDTATNYPINSNPKDFGLALNWIAKWTAKNSIKNLDVYLKIGAENNLGSSNTILESVNLKKIVDDLLLKLDSNLGTLAIHWDNRGSNKEDKEEILKTLKFLKKYQSDALKFGLSGLKHPIIYSEFSNVINNWIIQVKENIFTSADRERYEPYFPHAKFIAYGINSNHVNHENLKKNIFNSFKDSNTQISKKINLKNYFDLSLLFSFCNNSIDSYIVAPSSVNQLSQTIDSLKKLENASLKSEDKLEIYKQIKKLANSKYE